MIAHIAQREWREQLRHPAMLGICATLLVLLAGLCLVALGLLQAASLEPDALEQLGRQLGSSTAEAEKLVDGMVTGVLTAYDFLIFSQYLGFVGVLAGHSLLHDRQVGTLPFLLLAPIRRQTLLAGKVVGALGPLTVIYVIIGAAGGLLALSLPITHAYPELGPSGASWWLALLLSGPAWACFVATTCAVVSSVARDVRLAQQGVWFVVFFVQLLVAFLITGALGSVPSQLAATALGAVCTAVAMAVGSTVLSRDLGR